MTQNEKDILLKDLCARLPYDVKVNCNDKVYNFSSIYGFNICVLSNDNEANAFTTAGLKPYLFPLSSMTEEQRLEYDKIIYHSIELHHKEYSDVVEIDLFDTLQEFYNKNHIDYRSLIPMGLANDATGKNIY